MTTLRSEHQTPTAPATPKDRLILNFPTLTLNDAYMGLFRAQALLALTERFFTLNADGDDGEHLHPSDLAFVLETVMDQLRETNEILTEMESFVNIERNQWTHTDRNDWGRLRRLWARGDSPQRGLILRCARVLDGRPEIRGEIEPLLKKLEARIRPLPPRERPRATTPQTTSDMGDEMLC